MLYVPTSEIFEKLPPCILNIHFHPIICLKAKKTTISYTLTF